MEKQPLNFPLYPDFEEISQIDLAELRVLQKKRFEQFIKPALSHYLTIESGEVDYPDEFQQEEMPDDETKSHQKLFLTQAKEFLEEWLSGTIPQKGCYLRLFNSDFNAKPGRQTPYFGFLSTRTNLNGHHTNGTMHGAQTLLGLLTPEWRLQLNMTLEEADQGYQQVVSQYEDSKEAPISKMEWGENRMFRFPTLLPGLVVDYSYWLNKPGNQDELASIVVNSCYTPLSITQSHFVRNDNFWQ